MRTAHQDEVAHFLNEQVTRGSWQFNLPHGWGQETYFASCGRTACFVKLGAAVERYQALAELDLTPRVIASGRLKDGTRILVQPQVEGRAPNRGDYRRHLDRFADVIRRVHRLPDILRLLPSAPSEEHSQAALRCLADLSARWQRCRPLVPAEAAFIDESLTTLAQRAASLPGRGLVASHNDICNANWLITPSGHLYLIDLESMSRDDPALDVGATLWWYYPPDLRREFLFRYGVRDDPSFEERMRLRMAMHCLSILLPREASFDRFEPARFSENLQDFRAALNGEENPQGYAD